MRFSGHLSPPYLSVSIHAPAGGATHNLQQRRPRLRFNPRARGGRDSSASSQTTARPFQSTRPRGARPGPDCFRQNGRVSIHAPAGGATFSTSVLICTILFQSTRPRGARRRRRVIYCYPQSFNPRARGGRDKFNSPPACHLRFQSTRPRGARQPRLPPKI